MGYLVGLLLIIIGVLVYLLDATTKVATFRIDALEQYIVTRKEAYLQLLQRVRDMDNKEMFEKDDEVGVTFTDIKNEIEEFSKIIEIE